MAEDVKRLLLQIDANVELLRRKLAQGDASVGRFETDTKRRMASIDRSIAGTGRGADTLSSRFNGLRGALAALGVTFGVMAFVSQSRDALNYAASLSETSQAIGVTVEQLQALRLAAEQNGGSVEGLDRGVAILNRTLGQAQAGIAAARQSFLAIGITKDQLASFRSAGDAIPAVVEGISRLSNPAQQAAAAQRLMGRGAAELLPILTQGAGAMDRWSSALHAAGYITQEQAEKADAAQDALGRLATTIRAELVTALVDSLPGILEVARALGELAVLAVRAISAIGEITSLGGFGSRWGTPIMGVVADSMRDTYHRRIAQMVDARRNDAAMAGADFDVAAETERAQRSPEARARWQAYRRLRPRPAPAATPRPPAGLDLDLSPPSGGGGGRGGRSNAAAEAERRAREQQRYEEEMRRLRIDELRAQLEGTQGLDERRAIQLDIISEERQTATADLQFRLAMGDINQVQFDRLTALRGALAATEDWAEALNHNLQVAEQENALADRREEIAQERLRLDAAAATTVEERRRIELELLELTYRMRRQALQRIIDESRDDGAIARAQLDLSALPGLQVREEAAVRRGSRGPLEEFSNTLPRTAAEMNEALERVAAEGLQSLNQGIVDAIMGAKSLGDIFRSIANSIIADLLRIAVQKAIIGPLTNLVMGGFGGGGGDAGLGSQLFSMFGGPRAAGGPVSPGRMYLVGEKRPEMFIPSVPGRIEPSAALGGGGVSVHVINQIDARGADREGLRLLAAEMEEQRRALPSTIVNVLQDAIDRRIVR